MELSDKDEIAQLFKEHLTDHKVNVDSSIWNGVSSAVGNAAGSSAIGSTSLLTKVIVAASSVTVLGVGTYFYTHSSSPEEAPKEVLIAPQQDTTSSTVTSNQLNQDALEEDVAIPKADIPEKSPKITLQETSDIEEEKSTEEHNTPLINDTISSTEKSLPNLLIPVIEEENNVEVIEDTTDEVDENSTNEQPKIIPELVVDTEQLGNQLYRFSLASNEFNDIQWELNDAHHINGNTAEFYFNESGEHIVIVSAAYNDEYIFKEIPVNIQIKGKLVHLPIVFTPDNDGVNDLFFIESIGLVTFNLTVFDEQRQIVFQTDDSDFKWDGIHSIKQTKVPSGNYHYIIVAEDEFGNTINAYKQLNIVY